MLEEIKKNPHLRVFNIGYECYVIFTGQDAQDKSAFIRIGNYPELTESIRNRIEEVVLANPSLGDPYFEKAETDRLITAGRQPVFMGVPAVIIRHKDFFGLAKMQATKIDAARNVKNERGLFLHYIDSHEIDARLNNTIFFSLRKQAVQDNHYHLYIKRVAQHFDRYSRPYSSRSLDKSGFAVIGGSVYLFQDGALCGVDVPRDYYCQLARCGFDPRRMTDAVFRQPNIALYRYLIDSTRKIKRPRIYVPDDTDANAIKSLLRFTKSKASYHAVQLTHAAAVGPFQLDVSFDQRNVVAHLNNDTTVRVDSGNARWHIRTKTSTSYGKILSGLPYRWALLPIKSLDSLIEKYLPSKFEVSMHGIESREVVFLNAGLTFFNKRALNAQRATVKKIRALSRRVNRHISLIAYYALRNMHSIARMLLQTYRDRSRGGVIAAQYVNILGKIITRAEKAHTNAYPPICADAYVELYETSAGIHQCINYSWDQDSRIIEHEHRVSASIVGLRNREAAERLYIAERKRLEALMRELDGERVVRAEKSASEEMRVPADRSVRARKSIPVWIGILLCAALLIGTLIFINIRQGNRLLPFGNWLDRDNALQDILPEDRDSHTGDGVAEAPEDDQLGSNQQEGDRRAEERIATDTAQSADRISAEDRVDITINGSAVLLDDVYLQVSTDSFGSFGVTIAEMIMVTNAIAVESGFRPVGAARTSGPDPNLIYPLNQLQLPPDQQGYRILKNDSIWAVAVDLISRQITEHIPELRLIRDSIVNTDDTDIRAGYRDRLMAIIETTFSGAIRVIARDIIQSI